MYEIKVNSRKATEELLEMNGFDKHLYSKILSLLDALDKPDVYKKRLSELDSNSFDKIKDFVEKTGTREILNTRSGQRLAGVIQSLKSLGINAVPDISTARGFEYYTDIVFELFDKNPDNNRSMFGGGRYDGLVGEFGVETIPTVGFGMGEATLKEFLFAHKLVPELKNEVDLTIILIGDTYYKSQSVIKKIRDEGINVSVDFTDKKVEKKLKNVDKSGVRYVMFIGEDELSTNSFPLKDLKIGKESKNSIERIISIVEDYRKG